MIEHIPEREKRTLGYQEEKAMTTLEKIRQYIERTKVDNGRHYDINIKEMLDLAHVAAETPIEAVSLAFEYGRAKGYRASKARATE